MKNTKKTVKLSLLDSEGNSPSFGVDETIETDSIKQAKTDFAHFLVANEGFEFSETTGFDVRRDGKDYTITTDEICAILATVIFDNAGGITLQIGDWAHWYGGFDGYIEQAAEDYKAYLDDGNTDGWDGHEDDAASLDPSYDDIRNGGDRGYFDADITDLIADDDLDTWGNIMDFVAALKKLGE